MDISPLRCHLTGVVRLTDGGKLQVPVRSEHDLLIHVRSGSGRITIGGEEGDFGPLKLYRCKPGDEIALRPAAGQPVCVYRISFAIVRLLPDGGAERAAADEGFFASRETGELAVADPDKAAGLIRSLEGALREEAGKGFFKAQSLFYELLHMIVHDRAAGGGPASRMDAVIAYARAHYAEDLPRAKLAAMAGVHPDYFSRLFRQATGCSFVDFVADIRIARAKERLLATRDGLLEIARQVGYMDEFYLSRKFKQIAGTTPTLYRKKPKTVFSLGSNYTAALLAVGHVPPVGSVTPWLGRRYDALLRSGRFQPLYWDACDIRRLKEGPRPDVIVCHDKQYNAEQLDRLRDIASTLALPLGSLSWREQLTIVAELVGEAAKARAWLARYDAGIEEAGAEVARHFAGRQSVLLLEVWSDELMVFGDTYGRAGHIVYQSFGLSPPPAVRERVMEGAGYVYIGKERLAEYDADALFLIVHGDRASRHTAEQLKSSAQWQALTAVKRGRVYEFDGGPFYGYDPASTEAQLRQIVCSLSG